MISMQDQIVDRRPRPAVPVNEGQDQLGFLPYDQETSFSGGRIALLSNYADAKSWIDEYTHPDRIVHPPLAQVVELDLVTHEPVGIYPRTKRPAQLFRLPASHSLELDTKSSRAARRSRDGRFIINLLGYCFGTRLQFHDLWFDAAVPIGKASLNIAPRVLSDFISHVYDVWRSWTECAQRLASNLLYMHCRAPAYPWYWEQFVFEYMVTDACYRLAVETATDETRLRNGDKDLLHKDRISALCEVFGLRNA